jgi:hypothetical protein
MFAADGRGRARRQRRDHSVGDLLTTSIRAEKAKLTLFEEAEGGPLKIAPLRADATPAYAAYQAEVVNKIGGLVAGMTYGAKKESALEHRRGSI